MMAAWLQSQIRAQTGGLIARSSLLVSWTYPDMIFNLIFNIFFLLVPPGVIFSIKRQERKIGELTVEEASLLAGK